MSLHGRYQIVILDPGKQHTVALRSTLRGQCRELGLSSPRDLVILDEDSFAHGFEPRSPTTAVYYGTAEPSDRCTAVATTLRERLIAILPLVLNLNGYKKQVPRCLHRVNGMQFDPADSRHSVVASWLFEELGLLRASRFVFISYRRAEAQAVAEQIDDALYKRSYRVFLDTHSLRYGVSFQEAIGDQLANADLLLLLDTREALKSRWVAEEFAQAQTLGLAILHVVWPDHTPPQEADLSEKEYLVRGDFIDDGYPLGSHSRLTDQALRRILHKTEALRARAYAARRRRVVDRLVPRVSAASGVVLTMSPIDRSLYVKGPKRRAARVYPIIGHPDAQIMHRVHKEHGKEHAAHEQLRLVYDPSGLLPTTEEHIRWLNGVIFPVKALSLTEFEPWLRKL